MKIATNTKLFEWMREDMDFDAGRITEGMGIAECGRELVEYVREVAAGRPTAPELTETELFAIHSVGRAF